MASPSWFQMIILALLGAAASIFYLKPSSPFSRFSPEQSKKKWHTIRNDDADLWCGKAYRPQWPAVDPGGRSVRPDILDHDILSFRCFSRMNVYFHGEDVAEIVCRLEPARKLYSPQSHHANHIEVITTGDTRSITVQCGDTKHALVTPKEGITLTFTVDLGTLASSHTATSFECQLYQSDDLNVVQVRSVEIYHLPARRQGTGSLSKLDRISGSVLVNSTADGRPLGRWEPVFPYGFYNSPGNLSELVLLGFNVLHRVPGLPKDPNLGYGHDYAALVKQAEELGIWVMHDMRWSWQSDALLTYQVEKWKNAPNLLTWYVGDEPDGTMEDPEAFNHALERVRELDSRYHVVSTAYNCADFFFEEYTRDVDVVMTDPYPIGLRSSMHGGLSIYNTVCNQTYGCCGCDNCDGRVEDISGRVDSYRTLLETYDRQAAIWLVPQLFGKESHWERFPTALEAQAMHLLGINHGVTGMVSWIWNDKVPEFTSIRDASSILSRLVTRYTHLLNSGNRQSVNLGPANDLKIWENSTHALVILVCFESSTSSQHDITFEQPLLSSSMVHRELGTVEMLQSSQDIRVSWPDGLSANVLSVVF